MHKFIRRNSKNGSFFKTNATLDYAKKKCRKRVTDGERTQERTCSFCRRTKL